MDFISLGESPLLKLAIFLATVSTWRGDRRGEEGRRRELAAAGFSGEMESTDELVTTNHTDPTRKCTPVPK
jgi:hypothetical protein